MLGLDTVGRYVELMKRMFSKPDNWKMFGKQLPKEMVKLGIDSIGIIILISIFMGAIMTMQTVLNTENPLLPQLPRYSTVLFLRDTMLLEFPSSFMSLLLAGKVGSNIASEIGSMRITEQIDALEIMGVNSSNYLILPKVVALVLCLPLLVVFSVFFGLIGGMGVAFFTAMITVADFVYGMQYAFVPYYLTYSLIKSLFFGFIIASISAFYGYYAYGGALDVGRASTNAVVNSSIFILLMNIVLTQLLLT